MHQVLNPVLYRKLQQCFGTVRVSNRGQAMIASPTEEADGRKRLLFTQDGEYYQVCCPYCKDTRYRLYISHMFGKRDAYGRRMRFLALCFNEQCLQREQNRMDLSERLEEDTVLQEAPIIEGATLPAEARVVSLPGPCVPLDRLKSTHPACDYLASRGFDPVDLAVRFGVTYCEYSAKYHFACNRIIFPVYEDEQLKGWQARYIGELPWKDRAKNKNLPPKYFSCPGSQFRSKCVLNWDSMKHWETGIVVEGPFDVYRGGSMFGGIFGNVPSPEQKKKFYSRFRTGHLVFLTDPEEYNKPATRLFVEEFVTRMPGRSCAVKLPDGTDPGSLEREFIREYVRAEAAKQGITVKYRKVRK